MRILAPSGAFNMPKHPIVMCKAPPYYFQKQHAVLADQFNASHLLASQAAMQSAEGAFASKWQA